MSERVKEIKILKRILEVKNSTLKIYRNCDSAPAIRNRKALEEEIYDLSCRLAKLNERPRTTECKVYTSSNGITAYGIKFRRKDKHISKSRINGKPKVSKEAACEAVDYLLSH